MSNICPVCHLPAKNKCDWCGFEIPSYDFISKEDANKFYKEIVLPYRTNLEEKAKDLLENTSNLVLKFNVKNTNENDENIVLVSANGKEIEFEKLFEITDGGDTYSILHVLGSLDREITIFSIDPNDEKILNLVINDKLCNKILMFITDFIYNTAN